MLFAAGLADVQADLDSLRTRLDTMVAAVGGTRLVIPVPRAPGEGEGEPLLLTDGSQGGLTGHEASAACTADAIAQGLELPVLARRRFRADSGSVLADVGRRPQTGGLAARHPAAKVSVLWRADLADELAWCYEYESGAWGYAGLRWLLVGPGGAVRIPGQRSASAVRVGARDVTRMHAAIGRAVESARQSGPAQSGPVPPGIGQARLALVRELSTHADRILHGRCGARVNRELLAATAQAALLAGGLTYACWPSAALAQAYLIQALALAQACGDRQLGAAALCAMSGQASFNGHLDEARDLVSTALRGAGDVAAPQFSAHLRLLTARDYIHRKQLTSCIRALKDAVTEFDRAVPGGKPGWTLWFTEADPVLFALVLADAYLAAGLPGPAHETQSVARQLANRA
jgi:hypothetical protein